MNIIGIDIGGSTTKIIGLKNGETMTPMQVKATDPITSVYGAFGKYININKMSINDISKIMVTGVGASFIKDDIYGIKTTFVNEFTAIGKGGLYLSGLESAVIISMGTGTAFVKADSKKIAWMGGTGVGGGTLLGLSSKLLSIRNFESIVNLAEEGNIHNIDLSVGDISSATTASMPFETTASNFGKISDYATKSDIALGLINMVFQTIGMMAVFACRIDGTNDVVLCGNLTTIPHTPQFFEVIQKLHGIKFHVPIHAEYATALGAALTEV
jgi:type II pantothenate kinase